MENSNVTPLVPKDKKKDENESLVSSLSPREIVSELDRFVVGQNKACLLYTSPSPRDRG